MSAHCYACAAPLSGDFKGTSEIYCRHCCDDQGVLKPRAEIERGIAQWFRSWQPNLDDATALKRADLYLRSMPAWADDASG
jgi:hypothetical protein